MNNIWILFEILINLYQGWVYTYFLRRRLNIKLERTKMEKALATVCVIGIIAIFYSLYIWFDMPINDLIAFVFTFIYSLYLFEERWYISLFWNVITGVIILSVASSVSSLFINLAGISWDSLMNPSVLRLSFVLMSNLLIFLAYHFLSMPKIAGGRLSWISYSVFFLLNVIVLVALEIQYHLSWQKSIPQEPILITIFCLLLIIAGMLILFEVLSNKSKEYADLELKIKTANLNKTHLHEMQSMYQNISEFRHDMKHQLIILQKMIEEGRFDESSVYLDKLKTASPPVSYMTGCISLDALLSTKVSYMKQLKIDFKFTPYPLDDIPIEETAFCAIVGNLLDNAIEAVLRISARITDRTIHLSFSRARDIFFITCTNPTDGKPLRTIGSSFVSSKRKNAKGFGIDSIRHTVEQAEGFCKFEVVDSNFNAEIALPYLGENQNG